MQLFLVYSVRKCWSSIFPRVLWALASKNLSGIWGTAENIPEVLPNPSEAWHQTFEESSTNHFLTPWLAGGFVLTGYSPNPAVLSCVGVA
jgi:hypothetical protein